MSLKTLLSSLGSALLAHYHDRISRDEPDGLFEIDQVEQVKPLRPPKPVPVKPLIARAFIWDTLRNVFAISVVTFLLHMIVGEGEISMPEGLTVVIIIATSAALSHYPIKR